MTDTGEDREQPLRPEERLAARVRELRRRRGLSQEELARRMTELGHPMHQTTIAKLEKGERPVRVDEAFGLARLLDVRLAEFFVEDVDPVVRARERDRVVEEYQRAHQKYVTAKLRYLDARTAAQDAWADQEEAFQEFSRLESELEALAPVEDDRD